jgi:hypothetical protein
MSRVTAEDIDRHSMRPGCRYRVTFRDCALEGEFTATFVGWGRYNWDVTTDQPDVISELSLDDGAEFSLWDNGLRLGPVEGYWTVYPAD